MNQRTLARSQGLFYLASGLWPILSMKTFARVTGEKKDDWLAKTVGLLIASTGAALLGSSLRQKQKEPPLELSLLAAGQSAILGSVSLYYSLKQRISIIYLLDSMTEFFIVSLWTRQLTQNKERTSIVYLLNT